MSYIWDRVDTFLATAEIKSRDDLRFEKTERQKEEVCKKMIEAVKSDVVLPD